MSFRFEGWDHLAESLRIRLPNGVQRHDDLEFAIVIEKGLHNVLFVPEKSSLIDPTAWVFRRNVNVVDMYYDARCEIRHDREIFMNHIAADLCRMGGIDDQNIPRLQGGK